MNPNAEAIVRRLQQAGHTAYYAGGCVRDLLLGRPAKDIDIATDARPDQTQKLFRRVTDLQGKAFGVVRVTENGETFEVATFRKDGPYSDGRRPNSVEFATAQEDALRRDFTVNGLFYNPITREVIDLVGGRDDLAARRLRAIGRPHDRFSEDYLRLYRAVRFAAELGFEIEPETWDALRTLAPRGAELAVERVRDELIKCFTGANPGRALDLLDDSGLLHPWIPELARMKGVKQPPQFHPEGDVWTHVRMMMGMLRYPDTILAFSVLLHDIAKPDTYQVDETGRIRFNEHETRGARLAGDILLRLRFPNRDIEAVQACIANHMAFKDVPHMRISTLKRFLARPTLEIELELHRIDCSCSHGDLSILQFLKQKQQEFSQEQIKPPPLVTGHDLIALGLPPGKTIGRILAQLEEEQLEGKLTDKASALARARTLL